MGPKCPSSFSSPALHPPQSRAVQIANFPNPLLSSSAALPRVGVRHKRLGTVREGEEEGEGGVEHHKNVV
jgi:hypothetical protein